MTTHTHTRLDVAKAIEAGAEQIETYGLTPLRMVERGDAPDTERACCPVGGIYVRAGLDPYGDPPGSSFAHEAVSELAAYVVAHEDVVDQGDSDLTVFRWVAQFRPGDAAEVVAAMRDCAADIRRSA
ncbi:MAG: DUF6197 family protein [Micromonosporaceae bacterium]